VHKNVELSVNIKFKLVRLMILVFWKMYLENEI